jgi:hypothetical protein
MLHQFAGGLLLQILRGCGYYQSTPAGSSGLMPFSIFSKKTTKLATKNSLKRIMKFPEKITSLVIREQEIN